jgi:hypothetical protein
MPKFPKATLRRVLRSGEGGARLAKHSEVLVRPHMYSTAFLLVIFSTHDTGILELQHVPSQTGAGSFPSCSRPRIQGCRGRRHQRSSVRSTQAVQNMNFLPKVPFETNYEVS